MNRFRNPLVWVRRFRHRRGYGIHSPFAYNFVTQVLYSPGHYYAEEGMFTWRDCLLWPRRTAIYRLMFRLANFWQPSVIYAPAEFLPYLHAGCRGAALCEGEGVLRMDGARGELEVYLALPGRKAEWKEVLRRKDTVLSFDLYDLGIVFRQIGLKPQHYVINW